jgi:hypothetical protein
VRDNEEDKLLFSRVVRYAMGADRRISGDDHDEWILAMTRLTNGARKRRYVALCQIDNARECRRSLLDNIERELRARLTLQHPEASVADIEAQVAGILARGMQPSNSVPKPVHNMSVADIQDALGQKLSNERRRKLIRRAEVVYKETEAAAQKVAYRAGKTVYIREQRTNWKLDKAARKRVD